MSMTDFGPVEALFYNPSFDLEADATTGIAVGQISGELPLAAAQTLFELTNNKDNRTTIGGHTGVLEWFESPYPVIAPFAGWYLFGPLRFTPYKFSSGTIAASFSMPVAYLGDMA